VPTPNPSARPNGALVADSCASPAGCAAVGSYDNGSGATVPLAERWDGTSWRGQPAPVPAGATYAAFTGVSCALADACAAVGYYYDSAGTAVTLAEAWNGVRWRIQPTPNPAGVGGGLLAVSCTAASACTAVGSYDNGAGTSLALIERWNGTSWAIQLAPIHITPEPTNLLGVSCAAAAACTAVGAYDNTAGTAVPLALAWNGVTWTTQTVPAVAGATGGGLSAVSCTSARACTGAGSYDASTGGLASLAERWNGTSWAIQTVPAPAGATATELLAVSCTSARACGAVGEYYGQAAAIPARADGGAGAAVHPLALAWNGVHWSLQAAASPAGSSGAALRGLSCSSARACTAVGGYGTALRPSGLTLGESWNGTVWTVRVTPSPAGANASQLEAVSCRSARACTAVGAYDENAAVTDTLAEVWNGAAWRVQATPNPAGATDSYLNGVSCASARACTAVGGTSNATNGGLPLAEAWNGARWSVQAVPGPPGDTAATLYAVSCSSPGACTAVGFARNSAQLPVAFAERWNGARWQVQSLPKGLLRSWLFGVSCPAARACTAVGYYYNPGGNTKPLAEGWNGTSWRVQHVPVPATGGVFGSVSCTAPAACTATGANFNGTGEPLAERWNGTSWRSEATIAPPGYASSVGTISLLGVSCSTARACVAIGNYTPHNISATFAEAWHGGSWSLQATAAPAGTQQSVLNGVSCVTPACTAVGAYFGPSGVIVTLAETAPS
jgi:hypothetical protein